MAQYFEHGHSSEILVQFSSNPAFLLGNSVGGTSTLQYADTIGSPPVETLIVHDSTQTVPEQLPMTVTFTP